MIFTGVSQYTLPIPKLKNARDAHYALSFQQTERTRRVASQTLHSESRRSSVCAWTSCHHVVHKSGEISDILTGSLLGLAQIHRSCQGVQIMCRQSRRSNSRVSPSISSPCVTVEAVSLFQRRFVPDESSCRSQLTGQRTSEVVRAVNPPAVQLTVQYHPSLPFSAGRKPRKRFR